MDQCRRPDCGELLSAAEKNAYGGLCENCFSSNQPAGAPRPRFSPELLKASRRSKGEKPEKAK